MNVAILSFWHVHAEGYTKEIIEKTSSRVVAVWDEEEARGRKYAEQFSVPFIGDLDALLADAAIDGVVVTAPTSMHTEVILKAIRAGKKVFSEKVLALSSEGCDRIRAALDETGARITLSLVKKCEPAFRFAKSFVDAGELGKITYARMRNVHDGSIRNWLPAHFYNGEQCGGGAMIDLGAHPMYLLNWIVGTPKSIQSTFTDLTARGVEDNAVSVFEYESGAIAVSETGFVSRYTPQTLEIGGTLGSLIVRGGSVQYATEKTSGEWVSPDALPEAMKSPVVQWAEEAADDGLFGIDEASVLTRLMEAAYRSYMSGAREAV